MRGHLVPLNSRPGTDAQVDEGLSSVFRVSVKNSICSAFSDSGGAWPPAGWRFFFFPRFSFYFLPIENQRIFFFTV